MSTDTTKLALPWTLATQSAPWAEWRYGILDANGNLVAKGNVKEQMEHIIKSANKRKSR